GAIRNDSPGRARVAEASLARPEVVSAITRAASQFQETPSFAPVGKPLRVRTSWAVRIVWCLASVRYWPEGGLSDADQRTISSRFVTVRKKKKGLDFSKPFMNLVGRGGFEPPTNGLKVRCSTS